MSDRPSHQQYASEAEYLAQYDIHRYELPLSSVDVAIFSLLDSQLQVLLVERDAYPQRGRWALPGGFVDLKRDDSLEATAMRHLAAKTGVAAPWLEQVASFGGPDRDPRGWSLTVLYMALLPASPTLPHIEQVRDARWWPLDEALVLQLAFDHRELLLAARERLKNKTAYTALPVYVLDAPFSLPDLQTAFELLLDAPLEKKAFRRRIEDAGLLEDTGLSRPSPGRGRPAALYRPKAASRAHQFSRLLGQEG